MVGRSRVLGLERAFAPGAVACLVLGVGACVVETGPSGTVVGSTGVSGFGSGGTAPFLPVGSGATIDPGIVVEPPILVQPCSPPALTGSAVFADQMFDATRVARREFFSWTTDEQAAELRRDHVLFTRSERPGMGPGNAFQVIQSLAMDGEQPDRAAVARLIGGELFAKARFAWLEPWATRMGWPGEDYGGNLLRIVLKPEAWVAVIQNGDLAVFDEQNQHVPLPDVLATPTRLGAIFYEKGATSGGPSCGGSFVSGANGYREFILGNLAMVDEWSLGTQQIRDRLSANIEQLTTFLPRIRSCPVTSSAQQWNLAVVCRWDLGGLPSTESEAYERALAIPSDNYLAVPERIAAMIETLQGDLFEPDPLVVTPGSQ
ncbi:MAG TPA: hypothetical protein VER96_16690 [Polyangiaceae bacterium]|nr:hypothetical protein [Polyangiaceae bacterium]